MIFHPRKLLTYASGVLLSFVLASCGGGFAGIDGSGSKPVVEVSVSTSINGFGSVILDGVHYDTDNARVYMKGELTNEFELEVGDFVTLVGYMTDDNNGVAVEIHYQPKVSGIIDWIDSSSLQLSVLKQKVQTDSNTIFSGNLSPKNFFGIKRGASISVSGATDANGVIRATRVAVVDAAKTEISGKIDTIDFNTAMLKVNRLDVDFSGIASAEHLVVGKNTYITGVLNGDTLVASAIDTSMDIAKLSSIQRNQLEGFIGRVIDKNHFTLEGATVAILADTEFQNGTIDDLARNKRIRLEGRVSGQTVVADTIEFLERVNLQLSGEIEDIVPADENGKVLGHIIVQGQTYTLLRNTSLQKSRHRYFSFRDFRVGDTVSLSAFTNGTQNVVTKITVQTGRHDFSEFALEGAIRDVNIERGQFNIFGTLVLINEKTNYLCGKGVLDCDAQGLEDQSHAEIRGKMTPAGFVATSVRLHGKSSKKRARQFSGPDSERKSKRSWKRNKP